jgi:hypothetical protein
MISPAHNPLERLLGRSEIKNKAPVRYRVAVFSAMLFLGWLILELTQAF